MKIVFPEFDNPVIQSALRLHRDVKDGIIPLENFIHPEPIPIEAVPAKDLDEACELVKSHQADTMLAGIDYSSRDVILACRDHFGMAEGYSTFSGLAVMHRPSRTVPAPIDIPSSPSQTYLLADMAACKHPTKAQLIDIIWQTYHSAKAILRDEPRIALLSFSTLGSGGHDDFITLAQEIIPNFREQGILIDGEMQLDAAVSPMIGEKKAPGSPVAGHANVLIAPDLNSGNILYKSFEQFGGFTVAGPILQGFNFPISDLSRGSTPLDVILTIEVIARLASSIQH